MCSDHVQMLQRRRGHYIRGWSRVQLNRRQRLLLFPLHHSPLQTEERSVKQRARAEQLLSSWAPSALSYNIHEGEENDPQLLHFGSSRALSGELLKHRNSLSENLSAGSGEWVMESFPWEYKIISDEPHNQQRLRLPRYTGTAHLQTSLQRYLQSPNASQHTALLSVAAPSHQADCFPPIKILQKPSSSSSSAHWTHSSCKAC